MLKHGEVHAVPLGKTATVILSNMKHCTSQIPFAVFWSDQSEMWNETAPPAVLFWRHSKPDPCCPYGNARLFQRNVNVLENLDIPESEEEQSL